MRIICKVGPQKGVAGDKTGIRHPCVSHSTSDADELSVVRGEV